VQWCKKPQGKKIHVQYSAVGGYDKPIMKCALRKAVSLKDFKATLFVLYRPTNYTQNNSPCFVTFVAQLQF